MNSSFLFFAINGSGLGHLSRCLSYARRLAPKADCSFFTLASSIEYVERMGFVAEYLVSPFWSCNSNRHWNAELAVRFGLFLEETRPDVVVFDGTWPYQGFLSSCRSYRQKGGVLKMVWSRRGLLKQSSKVCPVPETVFDMVLEPGELGASLCETLLEGGPGRGTRKVAVPPVTLLRRDEIASRHEACTALGLDPARHHVLFSMGSGNLKDVNALGQQLVCRFQAQGYTPVWACPPISVHDIDLPEGVKSVSVFPLLRYMRAFDILVGAAGYNTCYEILEAQVPSLLVPNTLLADDQTRRAELIARHAPVVVSACEDAAAMDAAVGDIAALAASRKTFAPAGPDGAELAAQALLSLVSA